MCLLSLSIGGRQRHSGHSVPMLLTDCSAQLFATAAMQCDGITPTSAGVTGMTTDNSWGKTYRVMSNLFFPLNVNIYLLVVTVPHLMVHDTHFMKKQQLEQSGIYSQCSLCFARVALRPLITSGVMQPLWNHHYSPRSPSLIQGIMRYLYKLNLAVTEGWMRWLKLRIASREKNWQNQVFITVATHTMQKALFFFKAWGLLWHLQSLWHSKRGAGLELTMSDFQKR